MSHVAGGGADALQEKNATSHFSHPFLATSQLSPSTPSELIMIAQEVESRRVNLQFLEGFLPDVPVKDQVVPGLGWESVGRHRLGGHEHWILNLQDSFGGAGRLQVQGDHTEDDGGSSHHGSDNVNGGSGAPLEISGAGTGAQGQGKDAINDEKEEEEQEEEQELEEWEIEAEKHFQDSEDVAPAPAKAIAKPKKPADPPFNRQQLNAIMEQAAVQPLTFVQEQVCDPFLARVDNLALLGFTRGG